MYKKSNRWKKENSLSLMGKNTTKTEKMLMELQTEESKWETERNELMREIDALTQERKNLRSFQFEHLHNQGKLARLYDVGVWSMRMGTW